MLYSFISISLTPLANLTIWSPILVESVPGSIRTAEHFSCFMNRFIEYLKSRLRNSPAVEEQSPASFLRDCQKKMFIERKPLRLVYWKRSYEQGLLKGSSWSWFIERIPLKLVYYKEVLEIGLLKGTLWG